MTRQTMGILIAAALLGIFGRAHAAPSVSLYPYPAHQVGVSGYVRAGLTVIGESDWTSLTVGGGFTLTCGVQTVTAENAAYASFVAGHNAEFVHVPAVQPADYNVGGFNGLASGRCRSCTFQYRGRVQEGLTTINATPNGAGFVFTINGVDMTKADTQTFDICKPATSAGTGGCTP